MDQAHRRQVEAGWLAHVRGGGTTPWMQWINADPPAAGSPVERLPGAAQIETVRRLAEVAAEEQLLDGPDFENLANLVLARSAPGRGMAEQPLTWGDTDGASFGAPPIDPALTPSDELTRVCVGVLAELMRNRRQASNHVRADRRRPWARPFLLVGAPVSTSALRAALAADRRIEGGRRPEVLIVATNFDAMLQQVWTLRVLRGAEPRWGKFVNRWASRDQLPIASDIPLLAGHWAERVGPERVHVVVPEPDDDRNGHRHLRRTAATILGFPEPPAPQRVDVPALPPAAVDVLRRVNLVLGGRVDPDQRRALIRDWVGTLFRESRQVRLRMPADMSDWAQERSLRMTQDLRVGGYPVHGDLEQVVSRRTAEAHDAPRSGRVLETALRACLLAAKR